ncbi:metallopeptidase TldD-related protein [Sphingosinicella microcystinivorans]|uniref:Microcin-processing peptidase 2 n=1 Tax=Sphingosinicella microcystinivorans TaxID=335406 RepID=A0AAD1D7C4_SPHMI|nr:metallopeptidase TldD-related protein [Sphingosinicella microcystinivorans]RKS91190.1 microcin-processing peptidase 2 [Sphingosinicella microcystinivorans]BBE34156.1 peptidase C69 [Sphingosinicella microcystinivorans]
MNGGDLAIERARAVLLGPAGLDEAAIGRALGQLAGGGADLADLFFETTSLRSWRLEGGRVTNGAFSMRQGVGARAAHGGRVSFAHSADMREGALQDTVRAVRALARDGDTVHPQAIALNRRMGGHDLYPIIDAVAVEDATAWIALLERIDKIARGHDPRIVRIDANVRAQDTTLLVADADGLMAGDVRPMTILAVMVVAEADGRRARGQAGLGRRTGLDGFDTASVETMVAAAVRMALQNLEAIPAPVGEMPVVLGPGYPGVLFHEAVGHGLEGDHHRKHMSAFDGKVGEWVAAPGVTVIDDGGIAGQLGSLGIDDEGTAPDRTILVEDGVLTGLMQDRLNAGLMNARSTGNGRRQSYAHLPMPRMTNTFLANGQADPADIIASIDRGIYATEFDGGQVDIVTGRFNFTTIEAWLVEKGKLVAPVRGATLIGVGHEALRHISMVGNDLAFDTGMATCGKQGQTLSVSVGQPTVRIDRMMVGGQAG